MTHLEVLDDNNLRDDEKEEPADYNDEVSSPQIVHVQRECSLDIIRPADNARSRLSAVKSAGLVGPHDVRVLVHPGAVARDDVCPLANQRDPRKLGLHDGRPGIREGVDIVNPEKPPLHLEHGNEVPRILNDVREEDHGHAEGGVEVLEAEPESAEETL